MYSTNSIEVSLAFDFFFSRREREKEKIRRTRRKYCLYESFSNVEILYPPNLLIDYITHGRWTTFVIANLYFVNGDIYKNFRTPDSKRMSGLKSESRWHLTQKSRPVSLYSTASS